MITRIQKVVDKAFDYHFGLAQKCLNGERVYLSHKERRLAIQVELNELINECQEWKPWKKDKETDIEKVKEEIADVLLFEFDLFNEEPIHQIKDKNAKILWEINNTLRENFPPTFSAETFLQLDCLYMISAIMEKYEISMEDVLSAIESKIDKNMQRNDHK